jgi:hypothetical protein
MFDLHGKVALVPRSLMPELHVAHVRIHVRGPGIDVAERLLHHMQRITFLDRFCAVCVLQLVRCSGVGYWR